MRSLFSYHITRENIFWILGFSSTASALAFVIGGHVLSLFTLSLIIAFIIFITDEKNKNKGYNKEERCFLGWMIFGFASTIFGYLFFLDMPKWQEASLSYLPKIILYFLFFLYIRRNSNRSSYARNIISGIKVGVVINLLWCIFDSVVFYLTGESPTNTLFRSYIEAADIRDGGLAVIEAGGTVIRSGGLNGDPSNIGLFATLLAFYSLVKKKYYLLLLCVLSVFAAVSFIAFLGIIFEFFVYLILFKDKKVFKTSILFLCIFIIVFIFLYNSSLDVVQTFKMAFEYRLETKKEMDTSDIRVEFITQFIPALIQTPLALFIGTGFMTASYAYRGLFTGRSDFPHDPENHFVSTFFDIGLIGFLYYMLFFVSFLKKLWNKSLLLSSDYNLILFSCISGLFINFGSYHFTMYSVNFMVSYAAMSYVERPKVVNTQLNKL